MKGGIINNKLKLPQNYLGHGHLIPPKELRWLNYVKKGGAQYYQQPTQEVNNSSSKQEHVLTNEKLQRIIA